MGHIAERVWHWLESSTDGKFAALLTAVVLLRSGSFIRLDFEWLYVCVAEFPRLGGNFRCHNAAVWVLPALLNVDTNAEWRALHLALTACAALGTLLLIRLRYRGIQFRLIALWLGLSSAPIALLHTRVYYDVYTIFGGSLLALATRSPFVVAGGVLLGLTHPEQAIVGGLSFIAVALALGRARESRIQLGVLGCVIGVLLTKVHGLIDPPPGLSRAGVLGRSVVRSLRQAAQTGSMGLYACYGLSWLIIGAWLLSAPTTRRSNALLVLGLIVLPGIASLITLDGTRVFIVAAWPAFILFVTTVCERETARPSQMPLRAVTCLAMLMAWITPAYVTMGANVSKPQFGTLLERVMGG